MLLLFLDLRLLNLIFHFYSESVFDLIPKDDRDRMQMIKQIPFTSRPATADIASSSPTNVDHTAATPAHSLPGCSLASRFTSNQQEAADKPHAAAVPSAEAQRQACTPLFAGSAPGGSTFKPFAKEKEKQQRYERYLELSKQGKRCKLVCLILNIMIMKIH